MVTTSSLLQDGTIITNLQTSEHDEQQEIVYATS